MYQALFHNKEGENTRESKHILALLAHEDKGISMGKRNQYIGNPVYCSVNIWHLLLRVTCSYLFPTLDVDY